MNKTTTTTHKSGFTLIELLMVIAIIGILSTVVFAGLSSSRDNARDRSAIASMQSIMIEAQLFRGKNNGSYVNTTAFCGNAAIAALLTKVDTLTGTPPTCTVAGTGSTATFGVQATLNNGTTYCIDSSKFFGTGTLSGTTCSS